MKNGSVICLALKRSKSGRSMKREKKKTITEYTEEKETLDN